MTGKEDKFFPKKPQKKRVFRKIFSINIRVYILQIISRFIFFHKIHVDKNKRQ